MDLRKHIMYSGIFLLKSHVSQHYRRTASGQLSLIHDYWDKREKKEEEKKGQIEMLEPKFKVAVQQAEAKPEENVTPKEEPKQEAKPKEEAKKEAPQSETRGIQDFGEKIGGARKDTAVSSGPRSKAAKTAEDVPAWRRRFVAVEKVYDPGKWSILDTKTGSIVRRDDAARAYSSKEEAEAAIPLMAVAQKHRVYANSSSDTAKYGIYRRVSDRKIIKVVSQGFDSHEDAMRYMANHAEEIMNVKTSFGEEILPVPEKVHRQGPEFRKGPATAEQFMDTFGFRGVEFGNWNNQAERQEVMNHAYDGLLDLADALDVPPKTLSLGGDLALAFGARGQGLIGAKAHYERDYGVINLTKMSGAGSLAHEWFHAFDHYMGRKDTKALSMKVKNSDGHMVYQAKGAEKDYLSHGASYKSQITPEVKEVYKKLIDSMYTKPEQYVEDNQKAEQFVETSKESLKGQLDSIRKNLEKDLTKEYTWRKVKRGLGPASPEQLAEFDKLASKLVEGEDLKTAYKDDPKSRKRSPYSLSGRFTNDTLEGINKVLIDVRNRSGFNSDNNGTLDSIRNSMRRYNDRLQMLKDAQGQTEKTKNVPTSFAMEAKKIDQGRASDYWTTNHEMAARAFAAYSEDKIGEKGGKSDFLVYHAHGGILVPMIDGYVAYPYPEGEERQRINRAFDTLFDAIRRDRTLEKAARMLNRRDMLLKAGVYLLRRAA